MRNPFFRWMEEGGEFPGWVWGPAWDDWRWMSADRLRRVAIMPIPLNLFAAGLRWWWLWARCGVLRGRCYRLVHDADLLESILHRLETRR